MSVQGEVKVVVKAGDVGFQVRAVNFRRRRTGLQSLFDLFIQHVKAELFKRRQGLRLNFRRGGNHRHASGFVACQDLGDTGDLVDADMILAHPQIAVVVVVGVVHHLLYECIAGVDVTPDAHGDAQQAVLESQIILHVDRQGTDVLELRHERGAGLGQLDHNRFAVLANAAHLASADGTLDELGVVPLDAGLTRHGHRYRAVQERHQSHVDVQAGIGGVGAEGNGPQSILNEAKLLFRNAELHGEGEDTAANVFAGVAGLKALLIMTIDDKRENRLAMRILGDPRIFGEDIVPQLLLGLWSTHPQEAIAVILEDSVPFNSQRVREGQHGISTPYSRSQSRYTAASSAGPE